MRFDIRRQPVTGASDERRQCSKVGLRHLAGRPRQQPCDAAQQRFGAGNGLGCDDQAVIGQDQHIDPWSKALGNALGERQARPAIGNIRPFETIEALGDLSLAVGLHGKRNSVDAVDMQDDALRHQGMNGGLDRGAQPARVERLDGETLRLIGGRVALFDSPEQRGDRHGNHNVFGERIFQPSTGSLDPERVASLQRSVAAPRPGSNVGRARCWPKATAKQPIPAHPHSLPSKFLHKRPRGHGFGYSAAGITSDAGIADASKLRQ